MEAKTKDQLWGGETNKAVENFQLSGHPVPAPVIHWLGRLKAAAARANAGLGKLDADLAERIAKAETRSQTASTTTSSRSTSSRPARGRPPT
jgi:fumarate hydratase, class II